MSKHTPGPWRDIVLAKNTYIMNERGYVIAQISAGNAYKKSHKSNARLIAAAPELLDSLIKLLAQFDSEIHNEYDGTSMTDERLAEADHARAIIAKATGG